MKLIIFIFCLVLSLGAGAQIKPSYPILLAQGNSGYVTIGAQDYSRAEIGFAYNFSDSFATKSTTYDSTVSIYWQRDGSSIYSHVLDTMFKYGADSSNKQVLNITGLRTWLRANAYYRGN